MKKSARRKLGAQAFEELVGQQAFGFSQRLGIPLRAIHVVNANKCRFATHGEAHIVFDEVGIDVMAQLFNGRPLLFRIRESDAWGLHHAGHIHFEGELGLGGLEKSCDRRGAAGVRRGGQRQVALAGKQSGRGIQSHPACSGQENFTPRM